MKLIQPHTLQVASIVVSATFTAEPIEDSLVFWMNSMNIAPRIQFAPFNQIFQQLLDPTSLVAHNQRGVNIILLRFEDWINLTQIGREQVEIATIMHHQIKRNIQDLMQALTSSLTHSDAQYIVSSCPASSQFRSQDSAALSVFQEMEEHLEDLLQNLKGVYFLRSTDVMALYPVQAAYDPRTDKLWHVPYTTHFFTALGTHIARIIYALWRAPRKVIVLDCDQTLWKGVCEEDGAMGIEIDSFRRDLQQFVITQHDAGMLLCLCSKNNEADVMEVFHSRSDMELTLSLIVAWRINWLPKAQNLKSLAEELKLSLNSFIFIDDDPIECAHVQVQYPEVLTLLLPCEPEHIPAFLRHVWDFDHLRITEEDRKRTQLYQQEKQRQVLRQQTLTLKDFLDDLNLEILITNMEQMQVSRVAQLTQRTNQFNTTTIRRSEQQIKDLTQQADYTCLTVEVRDRFGNYGLIGISIFSIEANTLNVDTFLLSCRALGRGVEHRMLGYLGQIAQEKKISSVCVPYISTAKNGPALEFLLKIGAQFKRPLNNDESQLIFAFPSDYAMALAAYIPQEEKISNSPDPEVRQAQLSSEALEIMSPQLHKIATELQQVEQIQKAITASRR